MEDILTKGYAVIPNFLTAEEIQIFLDDYEMCQTYPGMKDKIDMGNVSYSASQSIKQKIQDTAAQTGLEVDLVVPYGMYTDTSKTTFMWHQDAGNYLIIPECYNYLNFYIPIDKPNPDISGISVVPMDALKASVPDYFNTFYKSAARRFIPQSNTTRVIEDEDGRRWTLPLNIDTIAVSPKLNTGDLLLLRGDVIHKTQDNLTKRIAVSIRATRGSAVASADRIFKKGTRVKKTWLGGFEQRMKEIFDKLGKDEITAEEMVQEWHTQIKL